MYSVCVLGFTKLMNVFLVLSQVIEQPSICKREWHSITAIPGDERGSSVVVAVIGGVILRDLKDDPTTWLKAKANYVLEFSKWFVMGHLSNVTKQKPHDYNLLVSILNIKGWMLYSVCFKRSQLK